MGQGFRFVPPSAFLISHLRESAMDGVPARGMTVCSNVIRGPGFFGE
jgi:hypothetical protein